MEKLYEEYDNGSKVTIFYGIQKPETTNPLLLNNVPYADIVVCNSLPVFEIKKQRETTLFSK